jgi:hypothetical protein
MVLSSLGAGALILRVLHVDGPLSWVDKLAWAFPLGFGVLGWVIFFAAAGGSITAIPLFAVCIIFLPGLYFIKREALSEEPTDSNIWLHLLLVALAVAVVCDLAEGFSPPADADTLAYHFATPKFFLAAGRLEFIPRAITGATPLLQQMTYLLAFGMGGETAATLWTMVSGWSAGFLLFVIARRYMDLNWALALTVVFITTPATIYASGTGQVEIRNASFVLLAVVAVARLLKTGFLRYAVLAGIAAGFFIGTKYTGLIFALSCGFVVIADRRWFMRGVTYTAAVVVTGFQWYAWNWVNTGDPIFPILYGIIPYSLDVPWNAAQNFILKTQFPINETAVAANLLWLFLYPFKATLAPAYQFESLRIGLGPFVLLLLPFSLAGIRAYRGNWKTNPLSVFAIICFLSYAIWFLAGSSQRVRHFVPLYPLLIICVTAAAYYSTQVFQQILKPMALAVVGVICLQLGGHLIFSVKYFQHIISGESRQAFLLKNVNGYGPVPWINKNLSSKDRVMVSQRGLTYLFEVPVFFAHPDIQAQVEVRPNVTDAVKFWRQLREQKITHLLAGTKADQDREKGGINYLTRAIEKEGCLREVRQFDSDARTSRTLPSYQAGTIRVRLLAVMPGRCRIAT